MHQRWISHGLSRFASRPAAPSRTTPTRSPPRRPAAQPAAATSSACGPPAGRCTPARPAAPPAVGPAGAGLALVGLQQDAGMGQRAGRGDAPPDHGVQPGALLLRENHDVSLAHLRPPAAAVSLDRTSMRPNPTSHKSRLTSY